MTQPYNICLALPIKTGDSGKIETLILKILKENPNFIELRFDFINNVSKITKSFLKRIRGLTKIPLIFTLRNKLEGGHIKLSSAIRLSTLTKLINANPDYIDIEINSPIELLREVIHLGLNKNIKFILSYHNFQTTESLKEAQQIIDTCKSKLSSIIELSNIAQNSIIFKLIFTANKFEDNLIPLKLCRNNNKQGNKIISFCMGEKGIFSRIMCVRAGSIFTYAAFHEQTAPGQINIKKMKLIYSLIDS
ncbi:MAG: type I 3-dehydroquinate dehydratase [Promethearchaeota archaeon]|nr:MAG: type I 3-dehydroquinate dehydratase [Candidatus Lokiarchaeota archaeon]